MQLSSTADLPHIHKAPHFFAKDFYLQEDRVVYACLEQRLYNATRTYAGAGNPVDTRMYRDSTTVRHRLIARHFQTFYHEKTTLGEHAEHMKNCYDGSKCDPKYLLWDEKIGMIRYQAPAGSLVCC